MTEELTGYGYFGSVDSLKAAVEKRKGDKKGNAVVFEGAQIISDKKGTRVEGNSKRILNVRVYKEGTLDIRANDSWDNE